MYGGNGEGSVEHGSVNPRSDVSEAAIRVLHVDDEPGFAELAAEFLERADERLTVTAATGAEPGLSALADGEFDCVVSDYDMPGTDGIEFLEAVRTEWPDLPFVLFTGKGSEAVAGEAVSAGATDYMQKETGTEQYAVLANRIVNAVEQYRAEREVRRTERRLREIAQSTTDCLWIFEGDLSELLFVSGYEDVWGRSSERLSKNPHDFLEAVHPDDEPRVRAAMDDLTGGDPVDIEYRIHDDAGDRRWVWVKGEPIVERDEVVRIVGFARNVTDRKARTRRIERQNNRLDALFEGFPEPTVAYTLAEEGPRIERVNDAFVETFRYDRPTAVGEPIDDLMVPESDRDRATRIDAQVRAGEPVDEILRRKTADGFREFRFRHVRLDNDDTIDGYAVYADVTEHLATERELQSQRQFVDQSLDALEEVFYVFDLDGTLRRWNRSLPAVTGYDLSRLEEMTVWDFFPPDERDDVSAAIERILDGERMSLEADLLTADGGRIPYEFTGTLLTDRAGDPSGVVGVARDITERREQWEALTRQNERLEEFVDIVSHDLRNPLGIAQGHLDLARKASQGRDETGDTPAAEADEAAAVDHLDSVAEALDRIDDIVDCLVRLAREGEVTDELDPVDLDETVEAAWSIAVDDSENPTFVAPEAGLGVVEADDSSLQGLFENLFTNAIDHAADDRAVTVRVKRTPDGIAVVDDGPGFDDPDSAFDPGYSTDTDGTGFGLRIVDRIAEAHGWTATATNALDGGARIDLTGVEFLDGA